MSQEGAPFFVGRTLCSRSITVQGWNTRADYYFWKAFSHILWTTWNRFFFNTVFRTKENRPLYLIVLESTMRKMEKKYLLCESFFTCWVPPFSLGSSFLLMGTQPSHEPCLVSLLLLPWGSGSTASAQHRGAANKESSWWPTSSQGSARQSKGLKNCEEFPCEPWKGLRKRKLAWI